MINEILGIKVDVGRPQKALNWKVKQPQLS